MEENLICLYFIFLFYSIFLAVLLTAFHRPSHPPTIFSSSTTTIAAHLSSLSSAFAATGFTTATAVKFGYVIRIVSSRNF
jgi:hypothetical protein